VDCSDPSLSKGSAGRSHKARRCVLSNRALVGTPRSRYRSEQPSVPRGWTGGTAVLLVSLLTWIMACSDVSAPSSPEIVDARAQAEGSLVHVLAVELDRRGPVTVDYGLPGAVRHRVDSESQRRHRILLPRLISDTTYGFTVRAGSSERQGIFQTGPLPDDLASISFEATGRPSSPLTILEVEQQNGFQGLVVVDGYGRPVWFYRTEGAAHGSTRRPNGNFVIVDREDGLVEVTTDRQVVARLPQEPEGRTLHHDVRSIDDGTILFLANDRRPVEGEVIAGEAIWEWIPETG